MSDCNYPEAAERAAADSFAGWWRTWRYFFWLLGLAVLILLFYGSENWRGHRAWEGYRQQLAARGEAVDAFALLPPPAPDAENFAMTPSLAGMQGFARRYDAASSGLKGGASERSNSWTRARTDLAAWYAAFLSATNGASRREPVAVATHFTPQEAALGVLEGLSECDPVLEELRAASRRPYSRFDIDYAHQPPTAILLPHLAPLKHLCQVLQLRAEAELALDRTEDALNDISLMFCLTDASRNEPILISQLVRFAQFHLVLQPIAEGLAHHQWSEAQLKILEARLRGFDFLADGRRAIQSESVLFGVGIIDYVCRSHGRLEGIADAGDGDREGFQLFPLLLHIAPRGWYDLEKLNLSRMSQDDLLPAFDLSRRQIAPGAARQGEERLTAALAPSRDALFFRHRLFSALCLPSLTRVSSRAAFIQTGVDLAALACALERHRLARGQVPEQLDSLTPQFIDRLPTDVINGQPLRYRRAEDGSFLLYSVGWNETDDGGAFGVAGKEGGVDLKLGDWVWHGP